MMDDLISRQNVLALLEQVNERVEDGYGFDLEAVTLSILDLPAKRTPERTETHACDLISREAAIDALGERPMVWMDNDEYALGARNQYDRDLLAIQTVPANDSNALECDGMRWIPCAERLPDITEHYVSDPCIVYCSNGAYGFAELEENVFGQVGWNCERDDEYHEPLGEVVAWMPLPEPWKGEE